MSVEAANDKRDFAAVDHGRGATTSGSAPNHGAPSSHQRYGGNPNWSRWNKDHGPLSAPQEAFFSPGFTVEKPRKFANAAPLGLAAFAYVTFLLSIINCNTLGLTVPNIVVGAALAYGGLIQLLAGMWEMASGNTFGAWVFSSFGGFWMSIGITFTPGGFGIIDAYGGETYQFYTGFGLYLIGWFIYTFLAWLATFRATVVFNLLIITVWLTLLLLGVAYIDNNGHAGGTGTVQPNIAVSRAGGGVGLAAAFLAWYVMTEGLLDKNSNSFFNLPSIPTPFTRKDRPPGFLEADLEAL